jgi:undecaprenyl-phosphate 4-deoxy-4-formamido-L-arabinose transferase
MGRRIDFSVVVPVYNEAANLKELIRRCMAVCDGTGKSYEVLLVDDGSSDPSQELIEKATPWYGGRLIGVFLNRNYGQHAAIMAGFEASEGAIVITLDADLQNPPEEIPRLLEKAEQGFDVVGSVRADRHDSFFRRSASSIVNLWVQRSTGIAMRDYGCMLRAYHRHIVEVMLQCPERSTFIPILANTFARNPAEIEVMHHKRVNGKSKYGLWKLLNLLFDLLTAMTTFPLRLLTVIGSIVSGIGLGLAGYLFLMRLIQGPHWAVEGVFTLFAVLFCFIGAQFLGLGLLGEYIGRIYHDVRARPRYFVHRVVGRKDSEV